MAQLMPLPLTVSCFSKIQIGFSPGQKAVKWACVCVFFLLKRMLLWNVVAQSSTGRMPLAAGLSRGVNGKRKLPPGCPPVCSPSASPRPANSLPQCTNFPFEKRPCRPAVSLQSQEPNYTANSFAGLFCLTISVSVCLQHCQLHKAEKKPTSVQCSAFLHAAL